MLKINNLHVFFQKQEIIRGVSLEIKPAEMVVIMGPNGSGKSTLANALMGHPQYRIARGKVILEGKDITNIDPDKKVKAGLFLAWQNPIAIPGISFAKLMRESEMPNNSRPNLGELRAYATKLQFSESLLIRSLNEGFSGGEKKKMEMLSAILLARKFVIFDEIDTGLDVDALKTVAREINALKKKGLGCLVITHYHRLIKLLDLDRVVVLGNGRVIKSGTQKLAEEIEETGYRLEN